MFKPYITNFNIRVIVKRGKDSLFSYKGEKVLDIMSDNSLFSVNELEVCADPFLFVNNDKLYLFYEKQYQLKGKGYLCMQSTKDLKSWDEEKVVLKEPFHMSFPFVFKHESSVFMVPETMADRSIRLYKADDDTLSSWSLVNRIIENEDNWVDSSIIFYKDIFYLFSTCTHHGVQEQHLWFSDSIYGPYKEHPQSPIYIGNDFGRNSGCVFMHNGELYRPTQDCRIEYGKQVHIIKIEELSPDKYQEVLYKENIIDTSDPFYKGGGHQYNFVVFKDKIVQTTDAKVRNYNIIETARRLLKFIKK